MASQSRLGGEVSSSGSWESGHELSPTSASSGMCPSAVGRSSISVFPDSPSAYRFWISRTCGGTESNLFLARLSVRSDPISPRSSGTEASRLHDTSSMVSDGQPEANPRGREDSLLLASESERREDPSLPARMAEESGSGSAVSALWERSSFVRPANPVRTLGNALSALWEAISVLRV